MPTGFDTESDCSAILAAILDSGTDFIGRYYSSVNPGKCLTPAEAKTLSDAGISLVSVYEDGPTRDSYFSHARGLRDAAAACHQAALVGQPAGSAIYFGVDYDAALPAINGPIKAYFQGVADGFAASAAGGAASYTVGVYGSGAVCKALTRAGLASLTWLADASHWLGTPGYIGWTIQQGASGTLDGVGIDRDNATEAFGGFRV